MKINRLVYGAVASLVVVLAWLGGRQNVEAQSVTTGTSTTIEWRMFSQEVAGTGGSSTANEFGSALTGRAVYGIVWLYNTGTGELRRVYTGCGDNYPDGCSMEVPALVADTTPSSSYGATHPSDRGWVPQ